MEAEAPVGRRRMPWLALLGACAAITVAIPAAHEALVWRNPQKLQQVLSALAAAPVRHCPEADPQPGEPAPRLSMRAVTGEFALVPPLQGGRPCAVLFIGPCTECVAKTLARWDRLRRQGYEIYAVTSSDREAARTFLTERGLTIPMLLEQTNWHAARAYNAVFRPRVYVVDRHGKLVYAQAERETATVAFQRARALLKEYSAAGKRESPGTDQPTTRAGRQPPDTRTGGR